MDRWQGKVAVVTGASAGIGLAIAKALIKEGMVVVGLARRKEKMLSEMKDVKGPGKFVALECNVGQEESVNEAFEYIKANLKTVHVLINNAGIVKLKTLEEADMAEIQEVVNVNLMGCVYCFKQAVKMMRARDDESYIININSIAGHKVPKPHWFASVEKSLDFNIYSPTKFALTSLSEVMTQELNGSKIRVTNLSPGYVKTSITSGAVKESLSHIPGLEPEDVANSVTYLIGTPTRVQITELSIQPLGGSL